MSEEVKCEFCNKEFSNISNLKYHQKNAKFCLELQNQKQNNYKCEYCNKEFASEKCLKQHIYHCKVFKDKQELIKVKAELNEIKITSKTDYNSSFLNISMPKIEDIWEVTPMPWQEGRSWAKGIESGISGLNYYLFSYSKNFPTSRSGSAVQSKKQILKNGRFERKKYISSLLNKYKTLFKKIGTRSTTKIQFSTEE